MYFHNCCIFDFFFLRRFRKVSVMARGKLNQGDFASTQPLGEEPGYGFNGDGIIPAFIV